MLKNMERVCRKIPEMNHGANVCSNSIINGDGSYNYVRRGKSNEQTHDRAPVRYYRVVDLMKILLDKGVEIDVMRYEMQNMWSENVRLK